MKLWILLAVLSCAFAQEEESGGILSSIRNAFNSARAAGSALFSTPESAPYESIKNETDYEERLYPARQWVCTSRTWENELPDLDDRASRSGLFMRLFRYITGANAQKLEIKMTTPVTMRWSPDAALTGGTYTMCFYIGEAHQGSAPAPSEPEVFLHQRPELRVIAMREGGYPDEADWAAMARALQESAITHGDTGYDFSTYYRAGYDAPMKFWNRRNEVWYVAA